jgi:hypothetical protein
VLHYDNSGGLLSTASLPSFLSRVKLDPFGAAVGALGTSNGWAIMKFDALTAKPLWSEPALIGVPVGPPTSVGGIQTDSQGNICVVATGLDPLSLKEVVQTSKWDGGTGANLWGPITYASPRIDDVEAVDITTDLFDDVVVIAGEGYQRDQGWTTLKYASADGSLIWGPIDFGTNQSSTRPIALVCDHSGNVIVTGTSLAPPIGSQWATIKYAKDSGGVIWGPSSISGDPLASTSPLLVAVDGQDNVVIEGYVGPSGSPTIWSSAKYDGATGAILWGPASVSYGNQNIYLRAIVVDGSSNLFELGYAYSYGTPSNWILLKRSGASGAQLWGPEPGTPVLDNNYPALALAQDPGGDPWVSGLDATGNFTTVAYAGPDGSTLLGPLSSAAVHAGSEPFGVETDLNGNVYSLQTLSSNSVGLTKLSRADGSVLWGPVEIGPSPSPTGYFSPFLSVDPNANPLVIANLTLNGAATEGLFKFDALNGNIVWGPMAIGPVGSSAQTFDPPISSATEVVVVGTATIPASGGVSVAEAFDPTTGTTLWSANLPPDFFPSSVAIDSSANVMVAGDWQYLWTLYKLSGVDGSILWGPVQPGLLPISSYPLLTLDAAGDVLATGSDGIDYPSSWATVKLNGQNGGVIWGPVLNIDFNGYDDYPIGIVADSVGNAIVTGVFTGNNGYHDWETIKYDGQTGAIIWGPIPYGENAFVDVAPFGLEIASDGNLIAAGEGLGPVFLPTALIKYDVTTGAVVWGPVNVNITWNTGFRYAKPDQSGFVLSQGDGGEAVTVLYDLILGIETRQEDVPPGFCGSAYAVGLIADNGSAPYSWSIVSGALPPGVFLDSATGLIGGDPTAEGIFSFRVRVTDSSNVFAERDFTIDILGSPSPALISASENPVCPGSQTTLSVVGGYQSYQWLPTGETTSSITVSPTNPTVYGVLASDMSGCVHQGSILVDVGFGPTPYVSAPLTAAPGETGLVALTPAVAGASYNWAVTNGAITSGQGTPQIQFTAGSAGSTMVVSVFETRTGGCTSNTEMALVQVDFLDVPASNPFHDFVDAIARNGITGGCGGGNFCPNASVLRSQMAVFLLRAEHGSTYTPPACTVQNFTDVPCSDPFSSWIYQLVAEGITGGCTATTFCPASPVQRDSMAVLLLVTEHGVGYSPFPCVPPGQFTDVPCPNGGFANWIYQLVAEGITGGCTATTYCPTQPVSRAQMAVFLVTMFQLQ